MRPPTSYDYLINGQNLRVRKTGPSTVVPQRHAVFVYDEAGRLIGEYDNLGRARNEHVWLADRPVALIVYTYSGTGTTPLTTTYYSVEADHLGTPRLITDSTQAQRWTWHSAPYGDTQPNENPASKGVLVYNLRFAGQYFDKETNLHYNWNRDYESTTGRYIESDPIGLAGGINTYAYVGTSPVTRADRYGLIWWVPVYYGVIYASEITLAAIVVAEIIGGVPNPVTRASELRLGSEPLPRSWAPCKSLTASGKQSALSMYPERNCTTLSSSVRQRAVDSRARASTPPITSSGLIPAFIRRSVPTILQSRRASLIRFAIHLME